MQSIDVALLRDNCAFTLSRKKFPNSKKITGEEAKREVKTSADSSRIKSSKILLVAEELDAVHDALNEVYTWCITNCAPSFFKAGIYFVKLELVPEFERVLSRCLNETLPPLVRKLQEVYWRRVEENKKNLNGLFNILDYPNLDELRDIFGMRWNWISFGVPDNLPSELRAIEKEKMEKLFNDASEQILIALRESFAKVIDHVTERLVVPAGEKPKTFRDSLFDSLTGFVSTFSNRNVMNDADLERLVIKAKAILAEIKGDKADEKTNTVRDNEELRQRIANGFAEIKTAVDASIVNKKSRKFEFED